MIIKRIKADHFTIVLGFITLITIGSPMVFAANDCLSSGRASKPVHIRIDANAKPFFHDHACKSKPNSRKGDICSTKREKPVLKFMLEGQRARDWELVRLELGQNDSSWPGNLPAGAFSDFEFDTDAGLKAGHPYVVLNPKKNEMKVKNNNCHAFEVHYRVVLKDPAGNEQTLHPIIDNKGTGF